MKKRLDFFQNFIWLLLLFAVSCTRTPLSIFTEYVSIETMPSYIIGTPDPGLYCPDFGEKLHISWEIPHSHMLETLEIRVALRFGNGKDESFTTPLNQRKGILVFSLLNVDFSEKKGIFTYKIELYHNGALIDSLVHQLWAERITIEDNQKSDS